MISQALILCLCTPLSHALEAYESGTDYVLFRNPSGRVWEYNPASSHSGHPTRGCILGVTLHGVVSPEKGPHKVFDADLLQTLALDHLHWGLGFRVKCLRFRV